MDPSNQEDVHPSEKETEPNADPLGWSSDELDFSRYIDMDAVHVEEGGVKYAVEDATTLKVERIDVYVDDIV